ncbi:MAG: sigma-70 family RNA polymerase sigma factor [Chloroflexota bacterium]|nr:sigma-70 family RNA polymerase sigma factor [Chloroflexota bacterium]
MDRDRERTLVDRARSDAAAFGELYDFYLPRIYGFAYRRLQERSVAEDVTATTFQRALEAVRQRDFRNDAFGGWLYRVAANGVVDHVRNGKRIVSLALTDGPVGDAFSASLDRDELRAAMTRLSGQQREVLTLRFYDDLNADEASAVLGCSRATFAVRLHRAITALRDAMTQEMVDVA